MQTPTANPSHAWEGSKKEEDEAVGHAHTPGTEVSLHPRGWRREDNGVVGEPAGRFLCSNKDGAENGVAGDSAISGRGALLHPQSEHL